MEALTDRQLTELEKQATESFKKKKLDFFSQPGIKQNFPWLTENIVRLQISADRLKNIDLGIGFSYAVPYVLSIIGMTVNSAQKINTLAEVDLAVMGVSASGMAFGILKSLYTDSPVADVYELVVGETTTKKVEGQYEAQEKEQLNQLISGTS